MTRIAGALLRGSFALWALLTPFNASLSAEAKCKAILPMKVVTVLRDFVNVDGTLLLGGKSQCTVVNIECRRALGICSDAEADVTTSAPLTQVSRISRAQFPIIKWGQGEVVASGEAGLCGWTEIYINLVNKSARLTSTTSTARPGCADAAKSKLLKSIIRDKTVVFTIGSDPYWRSIDPAYR